MPQEDIKKVLDAPDVRVRSATIIEHLRRLEGQPANTRSLVASLRRLLDPDGAIPLPIEYRSVPATPALTVTNRMGGCQS